METKTEFTQEELRVINDARNAYMRDWRDKHPDKVKEYNHRYWLKRAKEKQN